MSDKTHGAMPGKVAPKNGGSNTLDPRLHTNGKAPGACDSEGLHIDTTNDLNFATGTRHGKAEATQIAQLALAGHAVHQLRDGGYLVCKYGYTHHAPDFEALQAFARRLGVQQ